MRFVLVIVAFSLFFFPAAIGYARKLIRKRNDRLGIKRATEVQESESVSGIVPSTKPPLYPPVLQESTVPERVVSDGSTLRSRLARPPAPPNQPSVTAGLRKLQSLPPLKRAIVWADILSPPKALRDYDGHE